MENNGVTAVRGMVEQYYGTELSSKEDLKTTACCTGEAPPEHLKPLFAKIHPEVDARFYGCGSPIPDALEGCTVLDLGCGTGRDAYVLSALVGEKGKVIGVDMTPEQLAVAEQHKQYHAEAFGLKESNVTFKQGFIEDLAALGIEDNSVDVVVSNCVLNLSANKAAVFKELYRVLKPGGQLFFSDVFTDRRVPEALTKDPVLVGECLSGALYTEDFRRSLYEIGMPDFRVIAEGPIGLTDRAVEARIGMIDFKSLTISAFKLDALEDRCEDYGQVAVYKGGIPSHPHRYALDEEHVFELGRPKLVCGNTAAMLTDTRYAPYFEVSGDRSVHFGLFGKEQVVAASAIAEEPAPTAFSGGCC